MQAFVCCVGQVSQILLQFCWIHVLLCLKLLFVGVGVVVSPIFFFVVHEILLTSCTTLITFVVFYYVTFVSFSVVVVVVILRC